MKPKNLNAPGWHLNEVGNFLFQTYDFGLCRKHTGERHGI